MSNKSVITIAWIIIMLMVIIMGVVLFNDRQYAAVSVIVMLLACAPLFIRFEKKKPSAADISLLSVMIALSVLGRFAFAPLPFFKPVSAMVIITGMYLGAERGFICGAATAIISNFYFGQGPWTPFQMFSWGLIGLVSGLLARPLKNNKLLLGVFGALAGVLFSLLMDVWTGLWVDGELLISRYIANVITSLPVMLIYMLSNVIFLVILAKPLGRKLEHTLNKY